MPLEFYAPLFLRDAARGRWRKSAVQKNPWSGRLIRVRPGGDLNNQLDSNMC
jgi:hypothetical protein